MNPYFIAGPAQIGISGGPTSGHMVYNILEAHGGHLPADVHLCFQNTGKEREETLIFIEEMGKRWGVHVTWMEWCRVYGQDDDALTAQRDEGSVQEAELQRRLAEAENQIRLVAHTAGDLLEQVINATELFDEPISDEEIDETNAVIDSALAFAGPDCADGESAECAHSYANKLGCPECGEDFGK
jgi:hypothetical protein